MILFQLHSGSFFDESITKSLRGLIKEFKKETKIKTITIFSRCLNFRPEINKVIYRIVQESLNNVRKHSEAKKVSVNLRCSKNKFCIIIKDNGKGFDIKKISSEKFGIYLMKERASTINAKLDIISDKESGTKIIIKNKDDLKKWVI
jgi:two-component system sensor histidine kinase DegS